MLLLRSWRERITLNCEMPSPPDTLWVVLVWFYLYGLEHDFGKHDLRPTWLCSIVEVLLTRAKLKKRTGYYSALFFSVQQLFLVASAMSWLNSNSQSISSQIKTIILVRHLKSHTEWNNAERDKILPTTTGTYFGSNWYTRRNLACTQIMQNFWPTLVDDFQL